MRDEKEIREKEEQVIKDNKDLFYLVFDRKDDLIDIRTDYRVVGVFRDKLNYSCTINDRHIFKTAYKAYIRFVEKQNDGEDLKTFEGSSGLTTSCVEKLISTQLSENYKIKKEQFEKDFLKRNLERACSMAMEASELEKLVSFHVQTKTLPLEECIGPSSFEYDIRLKIRD